MAAHDSGQEAPGRAAHAPGMWFSAGMLGQGSSGLPARDKSSGSGIRFLFSWVVRTPCSLAPRLYLTGSYKRGYERWEARSEGS